MNWKYISGFFDADGSVTLATHTRGKNRTLQVSFHNNELTILKEIQAYIYEQLNLKGSISTKKARKNTHQDSYDLKYSYSGAMQVANKLDSMHPKKVHRIKIYNAIQEVTPRNGKYSKALLSKREQLEQEFWKH